jgi:hypothetical protein
MPSVVSVALSLCVFGLVVYVVIFRREQFAEIRKSFAHGLTPGPSKSKDDGPNKDRQWGSETASLHSDGLDLLDRLDSGRF